MHDAARRAAIEWTRAPARRERSCAFLAGLPLPSRRGDLLFVHASAEAPGEWMYVTDPSHAARCLAAAGARWVFCGHVHEPVLFYASAAGAAGAVPAGARASRSRSRRTGAGSRWPARCGQPRDGNTAACYAMMDIDAPTLTFHRVPYDWPAAAAKIRAAGLPESLAVRLERGE